MSSRVVFNNCHHFDRTNASQHKAHVAWSVPCETAAVAVEPQPHCLGPDQVLTTARYDTYLAHLRTAMPSRSDNDRVERRREIQHRFTDRRKVKSPQPFEASYIPHLQIRTRPQTHINPAPTPSTRRVHLSRSYRVSRGTEVILACRPSSRASRSTFRTSRSSSMLWRWRKCTTGPNWMPLLTT